MRYILWILGTPVVVLCVVMLYFVIRRHWIHTTRLRFIVAGADMDKLPSFNVMLFRWWWVWTPYGLRHLPRDERLERRFREWPM